jgi:hypothetical protein
LITDADARATPLPEKPDYVQPEITDYGDLAELTAGFSSRGQSDAPWPAPRRDWTFSTP